VIVNRQYHVLAIVHAGNGLRADLHEFRILPDGTALITAEYPVRWDTRAVGGPAHEDVFDSVVQRIDIKTGLVLYQWDSLDHVPVTDSYLDPSPRRPFDYFHVNSVQRLAGGDLLISSRNTSAAYLLDGLTGALIWRLGGRQSSFALAPGAAFGFQHDVESRAAGARIVTLFDDAGGPPGTANQSRGLKLELDLRAHTARVLAVYDHAPPLVAHAEGNYQLLPGGDALIGWGQAPYVTEFSRDGRTLFDARFVGPNSSYRAYRFPWIGLPTSRPAIAVAHGRGHARTVYASWNGATQVRAWRVLAGESPARLRPLGIKPWRSFETALTVRTTAPFLEVRALGHNGRSLGVSRVVRG
jgi:hypothetical protein